MAKRDKRRKEDEATGATSKSTEETRLNELEAQLSLICLRFFRGDWDQYLDYLAGSRVGTEQRREEMPMVEKLREMDMRTGYLEELLLDEVQDSVDHINFEGLLRIWDLCMLIDPEADPYPAPETDVQAAEPEPGERGPANGLLH